MRRNNQTHVSAGFSWEPENHLGNIPASYDFSVFGTCDAEGVEITAVHLLAVETEGRRYPAGGEPRRAELEAEFMQWLMHPAQFVVLNRLEAELCAEADEQRREHLETAANGTEN